MATTADMPSGPGGQHSGIPCDELLRSIAKANVQTAEWRRGMDKRMLHIEHRQNEIHADLQANTAETAAARSAIEAVRDGMVVVRATKAAAVWIAAIGAAAITVWQLVTHAWTGK